jgi:serine phosphatase RsbU (regulator of sigma subunit)
MMNKVVLLILILVSDIWPVWAQSVAVDDIQQLQKEMYQLYNQRDEAAFIDVISRLEETTTAKERIESELRIARDIQMSMVPQTFPERSDLDLYGLMTPAKEVGGDLYDFVIINFTSVWAMSAARAFPPSSS